MKPIIERIIVSYGDNPAPYSAQRIIITLHDQAAGPYLAIQGVNDEPDKLEDENNHEFYFQSIEEVNKFASLCRRMLRQYKDEELICGQKTIADTSE
jgi:hypothetical protein